VYSESVKVALKIASKLKEVEVVLEAKTGNNNGGDVRRSLTVGGKEGG
jgi:hypothetical protein